MTKAEIITIGTEILIGQTIDTNSAFIGENLEKNAIFINRRTSIRDEETQILETLKEALAQNDIVIMTGGLGPTKDDITKKVIAKFLNCDLIIHEESKTQLETFFKQRNREVTELSITQTLYPSKCTPLLNPMGFAPGMMYQTEDGKMFISLPGVPHEMKALMTKYILPIIQDKYQKNHIAHHVLNIVGITEANLAELLDPIESNLADKIAFAYLPSLKSLRLRISLNCSNEESKRWMSKFENLVEDVKAIIGKYCFSEGEITLEQHVGEKLLANKTTLATAESCTGGGLGARFVSVSGSSRYFSGGVIAYSNEVKMNVLGVNPETIEKFGAVSEETALEMVKGVAKLMGTNAAIATTGIAGPDGGSKEKPVGTVCVAVLYNDLIQVKKLNLGSDKRENIIERTIVSAMDMLRLMM